DQGYRVLAEVCHSLVRRCGREYIEFTSEERFEREEVLLFVVKVKDTDSFGHVWLSPGLTGAVKLR
ncbi:MAG: hypothetical protein ACK58T_05940, partial [Phycisphaerae bacterium]